MVKWIFFTCGGILALLLIGLVVVRKGELNEALEVAATERSQAESTLDRYAALLQQRELDEAYRQTSPDFQEATSFEVFAAIFKDLERRNGTLQRIERGGGGISEKGSPALWTAHIRATHVFASGNVVVMYWLRKRDPGRWEITGFKTYWKDE